MASEFADDTESVRRPTPAEARAALAGLGDDATQLAERVVTPRWYHPTLGVIVAVICSTQALPSPASVVFLPIALFALPLLVLVYRRRYGLWIAHPSGPRSRRLMGTLLVLLVLSFGAALLVKFTAIEYWWVLVPAGVGFLASVLIGRRYDDVLRGELSRTGGDAR